MLEQAADSLINYGIAGFVIVGFFAAATWLGRRLFGAHGLLTRLADQHVVFVQQLQVTQESIHQAIETSNEVQKKIVSLNEELIWRLEAWDRRRQGPKLIAAAEEYVKILRLIVRSLEIDADAELDNLTDSLRRLAQGADRPHAE